MAFLSLASIGWAQDTIRLTARDVAQNYGLKAEFLDDTNSLRNYLQTLPQNYAELSRTCTIIAQSANTMIQDLDADYHDGLVWFDNTHFLTNYDVDKSMLQLLIARAERYSHEYDSLEKVRVAEEQRKAKERALAEAKRIKAEKESALGKIRTDINNRHKTIAAICNDGSVTDKAKMKELKDIYYAYLSVYNKYDLSSTTDLDEMIATNQELQTFQTHLHDSVLGNNSYLAQITRFKDEFKTDSERFPNVYKSYSKLFKKISIPVTFATLEEYSQYVQRINDTKEVQRQYRQCIDELQRINTNSDNIANLYGKRYKEISSAYHTMFASQDFTPAFVTKEEGQRYLQGLKEFQEVQQHYINNFERLERIKAKGDQIQESNLKKNYDIVTSYKELLNHHSFVANFRTLDGAELYAQRLDNFELMQQAYDTLIRLRNDIQRKNDSIMNSKIADKYLLNGYKAIKKNQVLTPHFLTLPQSEDFIRTLKEFIYTEDQFLTAINERSQMLATRDEILSREGSYPNITKAYTRMAKSYEYYPIENLQDLQRYSNTQQRHMACQQIFIQALSGADAASYNQQLKRVSDTSKIRLILKIQ